MGNMLMDIQFIHILMPKLAQLSEMLSIYNFFWDSGPGHVQCLCVLHADV